MEIDVFLALTSAGVPEVAARSATEAIRKEMSVEVQEAQKELATKTDLSRLEASAKADLSLLRVEVEERFQDLKDKMASKVDLDKAKVEILGVMEEKFSAHLRWTFVAIGGGFGILGGMVNLLRLLP